MCAEASCPAIYEYDLEFTEQCVTVLQLYIGKFQEYVVNSGDQQLATRRDIVCAEGA